MQAPRQFRQLAGVAAPKAADGITIAVVPFGPGRRKGAELVTAGADVPGLGDQLDAGQQRVLGEGLEERRGAVEAAFAAAENRREVEAESIHPHCAGPMAQAVQDQAQHLGMADIEGVAAAAVIDVEAPVARQQLIVAAVVDALEAQRGAEVVAFATVVEDDIEDDFEAGVVEAVHHVAENRRIAAAEIAGMGAEEIQAVVAPVV